MKSLVRVIGRKRQKGRCPYCRDSLEEDLYECPACRATMHVECKDELKRCPIFGCGYHFSRGEVTADSGDFSSTLLTGWWTLIGVPLATLFGFGGGAIPAVAAEWWGSVFGIILGSCAGFALVFIAVAIVCEGIMDVLFADSTERAERAKDSGYQLFAFTLFSWMLVTLMALCGASFSTNLWTGGILAAVLAILASFDDSKPEPLNPPELIPFIDEVKIDEVKIDEVKIDEVKEEPRKASSGVIKLTIKERDNTAPEWAVDEL